MGKIVMIKNTTKYLSNTNLLFGLFFGLYFMAYQPL